MKVSKVIRLTGIIIAVEPYSTTFPGAQAEKIPDFKERSRVNSYLAKGTIPIVRNGIVSHEPIISGTSIKAVIRHECADAFIYSRIAKGEKVDVKNVYLWKLGQDADTLSNKEKLERGISTTVDVSQILKFREENPLIDVFGVFQIEGCLYVSMGVPSQKTDSIYLGGVRHDLKAFFVKEVCGDEGLTDYIEHRKTNTVLSQAKDRLKQLDKDLRAAYKIAKIDKSKDNEETLSIKADIANAKDDIKEAESNQGDTTISTQMPIPARHAAPAGTQFTQTITINNGSVRGLSMVVYGLGRLALKPKLGGLKAACGEIAATWEVAEFIDGVKDVKGHFAFGRQPVKTEDGSVKFEGAYEKAVFTEVDPAALVWWNQNALSTEWLK